MLEQLVAGGVLLVKHAIGGWSSSRCQDTRRTWTIDSHRGTKLDSHRFITYPFMQWLFAQPYGCHSGKTATLELYRIFTKRARIHY